MYRYKTPYVGHAKVFFLYFSILTGNKNFSSVNSLKIANIQILYGPENDNMNKMTCAPSEASDELAHPCNLISLPWHS